MSKYRNKIVVVDGIKFDSIKESERYIELKLLAKIGDISNLELQPMFSLYLNKKFICKYSADFKYKDKRKEVVIEDVKSPTTRINPAYRLKKKMTEAQEDIVITEIL